MITADEVKKLADLARLTLTDDEAEQLQKDISGVIAYIDIIQQVSIPDEVQKTSYLELENVFREDGEPHATGQYTDEIVAQFPDKKDNYLKVKKILS